MTSGNSSDNTSNLPELFSQWSNEPPYRTSMADVFDTADLNQAMSLLRQWKSSGLASKQNWPDSQKINIAICGFSTLNYLAPHVTWAALADGIIPEVTVGSYNQLFQDLSTPGSDVTDEKIDLLWIWAELSDLMPVDIFSDPEKLISEQGLRSVDEAIDMLMSSVVAARKRCKGFILINDYVPMRRSPKGIADSANDITFEYVYRYANDRLSKKITELGHASVFPLSYHLRQFGISHAIDPRLRLMGDCLFTPDFFFELSRKLRPYIRGLKAVSKKVLVLDLDNTLWGGVVGEDEWDGVQIGTGPAGKAFSDFQKAILELYKRGVILAINSKNNPDDAMDVFNRRDEMVLTKEHFASIQINWQDKATNCRLIAKDINVGLDSLVFWDDNPAERAMVRENTKDVYVVQPPEDVSTWAGILRECDLFDSLTLSSEDARRGQMYAEEKHRRDMEDSATDMQSFLASLNLKVKCQAACEENIPRIVSLLTRTNQFNLTTRRHSEETIRQWANDPQWKITSYAAEDRFGSYGIIGVTISKCSGDCSQLDTLLLSCRAMGKSIENVMITSVIQQARNCRCKNLSATYCPTKKNTPVKTFLPDSGFSKVSSDGDAVEYILDLDGYNINVPEHVKVKNIS